MAINLATKYSSQIDEVIRKGTLTGAGVNNDVDFVGARTVSIFSIHVKKALRKPYEIIRSPDCLLRFYSDIMLIFIYALNKKYRSSFPAAIFINI